MHSCINDLEIKSSLTNSLTSVIGIISIWMIICLIHCYLGNQASQHTDQTVCILLKNEPKNTQPKTLLTQNYIPTFDCKLVYIFERLCMLLLHLAIAFCMLSLIMQSDVRVQQAGIYHIKPDSQGCKCSLPCPTLQCLWWGQVWVYIPTQLTTTKLRYFFSLYMYSKTV